jgi:hypothetical protein
MITLVMVAGPTDVVEDTVGVNDVVRVVTTTNSVVEVTVIVDTTSLIKDVAVGVEEVTVLLASSTTLALDITWWRTAPIIAFARTGNGTEISRLSKPPRLDGLDEICPFVFRSWPTPRFPPPVMGVTAPRRLPAAAVTGLVAP